MTSNEKAPGKFTINFGSGTTIAKQHIGDNINSTSSDTVRIDKIDNNYIQQMKNSLQDFVQKVNSEAQKENINLGESETFQTKINELASTTEDLNGDVNEEKKRTIREKLQSVAVALVKVSPKIARTIIGFTPLAPFSSVIGETFEKIVESALNNNIT